MNNPQKTKHDQAQYGPLSLWFLIELVQRIVPLLKAYEIKDDDGGRAAELIFSICCLIDATSAEKFGKHVKPVLGFMDTVTLKEDPVTVLMPWRYSSIKDCVYTLLPILREHPKFSKMSADDFSMDDLVELQDLLRGG